MESLMTSSKTVPEQARLVRERWKTAALKALSLGHGVHWAADITGLPLAFVYRAGIEYGPAARRVLYPGRPSLRKSLA
jgi:hypothetical protein